VKLAGGVPVAVAARSGGFEPTVEEIAENIGTYTKAIVIKQPQQPSGAVYSDEFVAGVVKCAKSTIST